MSSSTTLKLNSDFKFDSLVQCPPLSFTDGRHAVFDVEMWFSADEFLDGVDADGAVEVSVKLLVTGKTADVSM